MSTNSGRIGQEFAIASARRVGNFARDVKRIYAQKQLRFSQTMALLCLSATVCLSITMPGITISDDYPRLKIEQVLLPVIMVFFIWFLFSGLVRPIRFNGMFVIGAFFCCSVVMSMIYGADILQHKLLLRDYYEIPKVWLPVAYFTLAVEAAMSETSLRRFLDFLAVTILLICFYAWAQFIGLGFTYYLNDFYTAGQHVDVALKLHHRVYSTMGNPNLLAQLCSWNLVGFTLAFLYNVGSKLRNLGVAFACLLTMVMASSRYGLLSAILGFALILMMTTPNRRRRAAQMGLLVLLLPVFAWTFAAVEITNKSVAERFAELRHPTEVGSLRDRLDKLWLEAGDYITKSPLLGHGPAKELFTGVYTDSEYLNILKEFGVIGFLPYIALYLFPLFLMAKGLKAGQRAGPLIENRFAATHLILCWGVVMAVTSLFMNIGMFTYFNDPLQGYLWLWFGLAAGAAKTITDAAGHSSARPLSRARVRYTAPRLESEVRPAQ